MSSDRAPLPDRSGSPFRTYEEFVAAIENRPSATSPLMWMAALSNRPQGLSEWMLRWLREPKSETEEARG